MFAALGRLCFRHRRLVLLLWTLLLLAGFGFGSQVFDRLEPQRASPVFESVRGANLIDEHSPAGGWVTGLLDGPPVEAVRGQATAAVADLKLIPGVHQVRSAWDSERLTSTDGKAGLIVVDLVNDLSSEQTTEAVDRVAERLHAISAPGLRVLAGGRLLVNREVNQQVAEDTTRGELVSIPAALVVMVLVFGGFLAAGVPVLGALCSIAGALLTLYGFSAMGDLDPNIVPVTTVLSLGLSLDYALLYVSRYKEERRDHEVVGAIERAAATAGRAIGYSAVIVGVSLAGLFVFQSPFYHAIGAAGVSVVAVAVLASLTLTPALLGALGNRIKPQRADSDEGRFARLARAVQRRPVTTVGVVGLVLVVSALPFLGVRFGNGGADLLPESFESRQVANITRDRFPGGGAPAIQLVARSTQAELQGYLGTLRGFAQVGQARQLAPEVALAEVFPVGDGRDDRAEDAVTWLREHRPAFPMYVTGNAAGLMDFRGEMAERLPWAILVVALGSFVMLFLLTGSVLVPVKALLMNTLSLGAAFGAIVLIFQDGFLAEVLGFTPTGTLETWVPVLVFMFAFGLSMDYEVFLLARIKEFHDAGLPNDRAVAVGLQRSGKIITSAALVMVVVFGGFAAGRMLGIKEMGLALAIAIAVDATLVRCLLVPATMTLMGRWNWWAPGPLRRLHDRFGLREGKSEKDRVPVG
ncbi:putative membrane protein [Acrocarpospora pleiomorpha]|uniref:Putative membrane protein n=1 Tax=Acrocarpospora pleiomorpha TaxID=90975 RepID=A0A5M3XKC2_9ACTN|nr:MMPL family transporter [Acrocarpospora pleiomorpha]GES21704.1 putative membrane protein [Acrocarpospora pleiomorpha]